MRAYVDQETCIGCAFCAESCPEVFRMEDNGFAKAYGSITPESKESAEEAADNCPVAAIELEG